MCGDDVNGIPHKVVINMGTGILREFDCCEKCANAIDHRLITIMNNYWWRGDDPKRRYKNWVSIKNK